MAVLFGTDASLSALPFGGGLFNAFSVAVSQGIAQAAGFGDTWVRSRGTICSASANVSGFVSSGTGGTYGPGIGAAALGSTSGRTGGTLTLTFITGCTLAFNAIPTGVGTDVQYLGNQTQSMGYVADGAVVQTWT